MNAQVIKKEIALFLLAGYETGEAVIAFIIKEYMKVIAFLLILFIFILTTCQFRPELVAVYQFTFIFFKWALPAVFISASTVRYLVD